ncbi:MAG: hypothetical protein HZB82_06235 [Deltaproteobacteria bacterium]|nr:hypothetical protein [Deltaproteobacteria bacterium]
MEYDILEKSAGLVASDEPQDTRLKYAARLFIGALPAFDECVIYVWNDNKRCMELKALHVKKDGGAKKSRTDSYGEGAQPPEGAQLLQDEGLAWVAIKSGKAIHAHSNAPFSEAAVWEGVRDSGLAGFKSVYVWPLMDSSGCYGAMYLKSRKKAVLTAGEKRVIRTAAFHTAMAIKFEWLARRQIIEHGELKGLKKKLVNAERLMALGDMAASIAHEIKNPLVSLGGFALRLRSKLGADSPHMPYVEMMLAEVAKIEKTMNGALRHLKDSLLELTRSDLNWILEEAAAVFEDDFKGCGIEVIKEFHNGPMPVDVDMEQLKIAFDNLIANAIQSMKHGGTLRLKTMTRGVWAVAEIADSGGGIDPRHLGQIFNPFFTTKDDGTGLGLPITNSIIMRHHGIIDVINDVGVGATFAVKLPLAV